MPLTYTPEQYLLLERKADVKSEYRAGDIFRMAGASEKHVMIVANIMYLIVGQLKERDCRAYSSDMRVSVADLYTYPDVIVLCGKARFEDDQKDTLINPNVIIEVLSKSTEAYDRGKKFEYYKRIASLTDYLLVSQDTPKIEHYSRQSNNQWKLTETSGPDKTNPIPSINCELPLSQVYDKIL